MTNIKDRQIALSMILCAAVCVLASAYPGSSEELPGSSELEGPAETQDVRSLDRRMTLLEQRLYSIETSINRLEQSAVSQRRPTVDQGARDQEISQLRAEYQRLLLRLDEIECGLVKLDERTKASAVRDARRTVAKTTDPCRIGPATPLRLSNRP